ncbi:hypothetical protein SKAU_G00128020 [Synaphobranchus kaupii]|uniref:Uncharacterized protein n=1 Tax=Synaphobranchus kaupii TaxID=118154 RepID=A0A9Q1FPU2_SYNKA|nr:hypothetical protein SKAU_G00128020 [Synaphobranchus kaupii]
MSSSQMGGTPRRHIQFWFVQLDSIIVCLTQDLCYTDCSTQGLGPADTRYPHTPPGCSKQPRKRQRADRRSGIDELLHPASDNEGTLIKELLNDYECFTLCPARSKSNSRGHQFLKSRSDRKADSSSHTLEDGKLIIAGGYVTPTGGGGSGRPRAFLCKPEAGTTAPRRIHPPPQQHRGEGGKGEPVPHQSQPRAHRKAEYFMRPFH